MKSRYKPRHAPALRDAVGFYRSQREKAGHEQPLLRPRLHYALEGIDVILENCDSELSDAGSFEFLLDQRGADLESKSVPSVQRLREQHGRFQMCIASWRELT
jgi:hypothetical protein